MIQPLRYPRHRGREHMNVSRCMAKACDSKATTITEVRFGRYGIGPIVIASCDVHAKDLLGNT